MEDKQPKTAKAERPETRVEKAEKPAKTITPGKEQPETRVEKAEDPATVVSKGKEQPQDRVAKAEKPEVAAAEAEPEQEQVQARYVLDLGEGRKIPVISTLNPHFGLSGKTVSIVVPVLNEDGSREGLQLENVPERLIKEKGKAK